MTDGDGAVRFGRAERIAVIITAAITIPVGVALGVANRRGSFAHPDPGSLFSSDHPVDGLLGGLVMLTIGAAFLALRPANLRYERWIQRTLFRLRRPIRPGRLRYWWDLVGSLVFAGIGLIAVTDSLVRLL